MNDFEYYAPLTVKEALAILKKGKQSAKVLAGGTDLIVQMKEKRLTPSALVDVKNIPELNRLEVDAKGNLHIGAAVPLWKIVTFAPLKKKFNMLLQGCSLIGSVQIRNRATMGGNICNAAPSADSAPPLLCLGAKVVAAGPKGNREIAIDDFFKGPGQTVLAKNELLVEAIIPAMPARSAGYYLRHTPRQEMDIANVGVGVFLTVSGSKVKEARIALGAVAPIPMRAIPAESFLAGKTIAEETINRAAEYAAACCTPISDVRASAEYRRELVKVLTRRAIKGACQALKIGC